MCNLYTQTKSVDEIARIFRDLQMPLHFPEGAPNLVARDIAITDAGAIVRAATDDYELVLRRWSWPGQNGRPVYNFRSDGREFPSGRCLIVADGFYEWRRTETGKRPQWITRPGREPFAFAGLWARSKQADGNELHSCAIVTTTPSEVVAPIHDRMPVILDRAAEGAWLDPASGEGELQELLAPAEELEVTEVSEAVNDVKNDGPEVLEPPLQLF
jgi:putative SOS response-associated peptidase YedK